ncbi:hypothetical protein ACN6LL_007970 [Streptomyces violaceoruber]
MQNETARAQRNGECVLLQMVRLPKQGKAVVVQNPCADVADAYDKAASEPAPGTYVAYYVLATLAALLRAEANGVPYLRAYGDDHGSILSVPVSLWTGGDDD